MSFVFLCATSAQVKAMLTDAQRAKQSLSQRLSWLNPFKDEEDENQGQYETRVLEQSMHKICALLAVGFGDAGAQIVAENMKKDGDLNPMVPGKRTVRGGKGCWRLDITVVSICRHTMQHTGWCN